MVPLSVSFLAAVKRKISVMFCAFGVLCFILKTSEKKLSFKKNLKIKIILRNEFSDESERIFQVLGSVKCFMRKIKLSDEYILLELFNKF